MPRGVRTRHEHVVVRYAARVAVVGDFNDWDGRVHPMRKRLGTGVFEIFLPGVALGSAYKLELRAADGGLLPLKADPVASAGELRSSNSSAMSKPASRVSFDGR